MTTNKRGKGQDLAWEPIWNNVWKDSSLDETREENSRYSYLPKALPRKSKGGDCEDCEQSDVADANSHISEFQFRLFETNETLVSKPLATKLTKKKWRVFCAKDSVPTLDDEIDHSSVCTKASGETLRDDVVTSSYATMASSAPSCTPRTVIPNVLPLAVNRDKCEVLENDAIENKRSVLERRLLRRLMCKGRDERTECSRIPTLVGMGDVGRRPLGSDKASRQPHLTFRGDPQGAAKCQPSDRYIITSSSAGAEILPFLNSGSIKSASAGNHMDEDTSDKSSHHQEGGDDIAHRGQESMDSNSRNCPKLNGSRSLIARPPKQQFGTEVWQGSEFRNVHVGDEEREPSESQELCIASANSDQEEPLSHLSGFGRMDMDQRPVLVHSMSGHTERSSVVGSLFRSVLGDEVLPSLGNTSRPRDAATISGSWTTEKRSPVRFEDMSEEGEVGWSPFRGYYVASGNTSEGSSFETDYDEEESRDQGTMLPWNETEEDHLSDASSLLTRDSDTIARNDNESDQDSLTWQQYASCIPSHDFRPRSVYVSRPPRTVIGRKTVRFSDEISDGYSTGIFSWGTINGF